MVSSQSRAWEPNIVICVFPTLLMDTSNFVYLKKENHCLKVVKLVLKNQIQLIVKFRSLFSFSGLFDPNIINITFISIILIVLNKFMLKIRKCFFISLHNFVYLLISPFLIKNWFIISESI